MTDPQQDNRNQRDEGPWYKQFWAWFILAPLILVMLAWIPFMTIVVKNADDVVIDNYYKEGRMYNLRLDQDRTASALGLRGELLLDLDVGEVVLTLAASASGYRLPAAVVLYLDHPVEADNDLSIRLVQAYPGRYLGDLPHRIQHRWYLRLLPLTTADAAAARVSGTAPGTAPETTAEAADPGNTSPGDDWRIVGELDLARGTRLKFGGDE